MDTNRTYGVELELADVPLPPGEDDVLRFLTQSMNDAGIVTDLAPDGSEDEPVGGCWKVVWDCTAGLTGGGGAELVSPPMRSHDGLEQVQRVYLVLDEIGATVNKHCGLHVHHDAGDLTPTQMVRVSALYRRHQEAISSLLPVFRRNNTYAMPEIALVHDVEAMRSVKSWTQPFERFRVSRAMSGGDRHRAVNWLAYASHGTVEFRQHHATLDAGEIIYWVLFTQAMVSAAMGDGGLQGMEMPDRWLRRANGDESSRREALMWADLSGQIADDPHYRDLRSHYRTARLLADGPPKAAFTSWPSAATTSASIA